MTAYTIEDRELKDWLFTATRDLCGEASRRVTSEIEAHYADAVAEFVAAGFKEHVARRKAVAELGDPRQARRWYRHANLTQQQYTWFSRVFSGEWCMTLHVPAGCIFMQCLLPMAYVMDKIWPWNMFVGMMLAVGLYIAPLFLLLHVAIPKWVRRDQWGRVYRAIVLSGSLILGWGAFGLYGYAYRDDATWFTSPMSIVVLTFAIYNLISPWQRGLQDKKRFREFIAYWTEGKPRTPEGTPPRATA